MPAWLDTALVIAAITAALGYFAWRGIHRRRAGSSKCASTCCCPGLYPLKTPTQKA